LNSISAGALPQNPLKSLQRCPYPLAGFKGPTSKGREGRVGRGKVRVREGRPVSSVQFVGNPS